MFIAQYLKDFILDSLSEHSSELDTVKFRIQAVQRDQVNNHNEHEEEIQRLTEENRKLRADFDALLAQLGLEFKTYPAQEERRALAPTVIIK